jgi:hypothetical protein
MLNIFATNRKLNLEKTMRGINPKATEITIVPFSVVFQAREGLWAGEREQV